MKPLLSIILSIVSLSLLSGCYEFNNQPYKSSDLTPVGKTKFGVSFIETVKSLPDNDFTKNIKGNLGKDMLVREITSDFLITQNKKKGKWELGVITKNSHHIMFCTLFENEKAKIPSNVTVKKVKDGMGHSYEVDGNQESLKKFADIMTLSGPKICMAIPYAEVTETEKSGGFFSKFFK